MKLIEERPFSMADGCSDNFFFFLYSSNLLTEPVCPEKRIPLYIALRESQGRWKSFFGDTDVHDFKKLSCHNDQSTFTLVAFENIECQSVASNRSHANSKLA